MRRVSGLVQSRWDTYMEEVQHGWNEIENEIEYDNGDGVDKVYFAHCRWDKWIEEVLHDWERWAMSTTMETSSTRRTTLSLQAVDFSNCQIRQEQCRLVSGVESCRWQSVANEVPPLLGATLWDGMVWLSHWISYIFVYSSQDPASILTDAFGSQVPRSHNTRLVTPFFRLIVVVGKKSDRRRVWHFMEREDCPRKRRDPKPRRGLDFTGGPVADMTLRSTTDNGHPTTKNVRTIVVSVRLSAISPQIVRRSASRWTWSGRHNAASFVAYNSTQIALSQFVILDWCRVSPRHKSRSAPWSCLLDVWGVSNGMSRIRYVDGNTKDHTTTAKAEADKDSDLLTVFQGASETKKQRK